MQKWKFNSLQFLPERGGFEFIKDREREAETWRGCSNDRKRLDFFIVREGKGG